MSEDFGTCRTCGGALKRLEIWVHDRPEGGWSGLPHDADPVFFDRRMVTTTDLPGGPNVCANADPRIVGISQDGGH